MASSIDPSVKGSLVLGAVVTVRRHRTQGRISADQLAARLSGPALELVDQKIDIGRWYPVKVFTELLDLDWDIGSRRDPDYMRRQGEQAADRLFSSGIYQQLNYAERADRVVSAKELKSQSKLITTITGTLYNFLHFEVQLAEGGGEALEIVFSNATLFSEALRHSTEGFMNQINQRQGSSHRWLSRRDQPDVIVFTLPLPSRLLAER
ncbi:MAG TPA: hypothetical protein VII72_03800 [Myxococcota bacterium]